MLRVAHLVSEGIKTPNQPVVLSVRDGVYERYFRLVDPTPKPTPTVMLCDVRVIGSSLHAPCAPPSVGHISQGSLAGDSGTVTSFFLRFGVSPAFLGSCGNRYHNYAFVAFSSV